MPVQIKSQPNTVSVRQVCEQGQSLQAVSQVDQLFHFPDACLTAVYFGVPVLFAKKSAGSNMDKDVYATEVKSFTHNKVNHVVASKKYLNAGEHILIMDDFLANGCAVQGLIDLVKQAGGIVEGVGICIEKGFQGGGDELRASGIDVKSLAIIEKMDAETGTITFR